MHNIILPLYLQEQVKTAFVSPAVRAALGHLPSPISLKLDLPKGEHDVPVCVAALLKTAKYVPLIKLDSVEQSHVAPNCKLYATANGRSMELTLPLSEPQEPLENLVDRILLELFNLKELGVLIRRVAFMGATASTLQRITTHMLQTYDLDQALFILLSGITAGYCLGFNRAIFFKHELKAGALVGHSAIGPASEAEARQIWESIEAEDMGVDELVAGYQINRPETPLQRAVKGVRIPLFGQEDEFTCALRSDEPLLFQAETPQSSHLVELKAGKEFVLASVRAHRRLLGVIYADDCFLPHPIDPIRLRYLKFFIDQTALVWENLELLGKQQELAQRDPLTGAYNRRELDPRLDKAVEQALKNEESLCVMVLDVDRFKEINDQRGHKEGDRILRGVVTLAGTVVRDGDILVRYGGDEFVIVLAHASHEAGLSVARRIVDAVKDRLGITLSIGCAVLGEDGCTGEELFQVADKRLFVAKANGRARVV